MRSGRSQRITFELIPDNLAESQPLPPTFQDEESERQKVYAAAFTPKIIEPYIQRIKPYLHDPVEHLPESVRLAQKELVSHAHIYSADPKQYREFYNYLWHSLSDVTSKEMTSGTLATFYTGCMHSADACSPNCAGSLPKDPSELCEFTVYKYDPSAPREKRIIQLHKPDDTMKALMYIPHDAEFYGLTQEDADELVKNGTYFINVRRYDHESAYSTKKTVSVENYPQHFVPVKDLVSHHVVLPTAALPAKKKETEVQSTTASTSETSSEGLTGLQIGMIILFVLLVVLLLVGLLFWWVRSGKGASWLQKFSKSSPTNNESMTVIS